MNVEWRWLGHRLDLELAVALDVTAGRLLAARSAGQLERAVASVLRLWRMTRMLAEGCPTLDERAMLVDAADHVAVLLVADAAPCPDPRDLAFIAGRGLALARDLAGEAATVRARDALLAEWSASSRRRFEDWLLDRLDVATSRRGLVASPTLERFR